MLVSRIELPTALSSFGLHVWAGIEEREAYPAPITQGNILVITQRPGEENRGTLLGQWKELESRGKDQRRPRSRWECIF